MKLKELKRTVNMCWSPAEHHTLMLAAGAAAQQVDASFNSSSYLELYSLNLEDSGQDMELKCSLQTEQKFQKIVWSGANVIVGGCDGGLLQFYGVDKLLNNPLDALLGSNTKHSGQVSALDINPYQKNLLASGASDSEIFIWDLNNTSQPMAPGARSQPLDHVQALAWNQQVQHILGSTFSSRCVVWDLRKNEPIMKLSDSQSRTRWRALAWHPAVATQLCIASEEDQVPVIQLWDLRLAASPLATLEGHRKGVLALSWCRQDAGLLLSAGKDGRLLCWDPSDTTPGGAPLELSQQGQWVLDVQWSPRCPALLAAASFDHQLSVHSLFGGSRPETSPQSASNIMESFGGAGSFSQLPQVPRAAAAAAAPPAPQPPRAPAWLARPAAAKLAFGGKLVSFDKCPAEAGAPRRVYISQVVSEPEMVETAVDMETVLGDALDPAPAAAARLAQFCLERGDAAADQTERYTWFFLRASFLQHFRGEALNLLGFKQDDIPSKFKSQTVGDVTKAEPAGLSRGESTETEAELSTDTSTDLSDAQTLIERKLANLDLDVEPTVENVVIPNGEDSTSLICRALVAGNLEEAVELCLEAGRTADALCIACLGSQELVYKVQKYHLRQCGAEPVALLARGVLTARWDVLVRGASAASWRHTLAALLTHCDGEALAHYCEMLGDKLAQEADSALAEAATVCYLVGMAPEPLLARWNRTRAPHDVAALARLATLALLARRAAAHRGRQTQEGGTLEAVLVEYAARLAAQGCLHAALRTLQGVPRSALRDALSAALARTTAQQQPAAPGGRSRTMSSHSQKRGHVLHNDAPAYGAVPPSYDQQWGQTSVAAPTFPQRGFQPQLPPQPLQPPPLQPQPLQPQPLQPQSLQSQPPLSQPPRPGSVGPQSGGITSRSKYKVDPSVQCSPLYNQYSFNNPVTSQPSYGYNSPIPDQYSSVSNFAPINPLNSGPNQNPMNPGLNQTNPGMAPLNPGLNPVNPGLNPVSPGLNPVNPGLNPVNPGVPVNPAVNGGYYEANKPSAPPGWNDPPMMTHKPKHIDTVGMCARHAGTRRWGHAIQHRRDRDRDEPKQEVVNQAPITHPLFGTEPPQTVPLNPAQYPGQQQQQYPGQQPQYPGQQQQYPGQQQQYPGQQQQYPGEQYPGQYEQQYQQVPAYTQQAQEAVAAPAPAPKGPLPPEHAPLQAVFESLRGQCAERATNPQIKRKLEDIQRRLEILYDMLREYKLSESALQSLHACAAGARGGDGAACAQACAALAGGADFAAAASFLPALKGLLQLANQLGVAAE